MPNYRPAVPLISNHNIGETSPRCEMGKHKQLSLDTHKYKTTFTLTTKIVLRFSSCFIFSSSSTTRTMTLSASNGAYDTLISLHDKLTRLNGVITPEAVNKFEDELGRIFTVTKTHHYKQ